MNVPAFTGALAAALLLAAAPAAGAGEVHRFAVVVGNNHPLPGHDYPALQYADDDALRFAALMMRLGADVELFAGPDRDTAERFGDLAERARAPQRARLLAALERLEARLSALEGARREVWVYFSGHGSVTSSKAYLHLLDAPFTRTDLRSSILDRLSAERVHVIVDSCHSYFLVNPRGDGRVRVETDEGGLERYPRAGFLLSTSAKKEVQEWSGYEAGVFSYQLLGAMQGAADVDLDGRVTYAEAHAYVVAANAGVENPAARVQPFVHRPAVGEAVLLDLSEVPAQARLQVPPALEGHFFIVDGRGQRVLDAHKPSGQPLALFVPPDTDLVLWAGGEAYGVLRQKGEPPQLSRRLLAAGGRPAVTSRGAVADELRENLFRRPLTMEFVAGLDAAVSFRAIPILGGRAVRRDGLHPVTWGLIGSGAAGLALGGVAAGLFAKARADANPPLLTDDNAAGVEAARARAVDYQGVMIGAFAGGAALLGAGLLYELLGDDDPTVGWVAIPEPGGARMSVSGAW